MKFSTKNIEQMLDNFHKDKHGNWKEWPLRIPLSKNDIERIDKGHPCTMPEDRWNMQLVDGSFYISRWTGIPIFILEVQIHENGGFICRMEANQNSEEFKSIGLKKCYKSLREIFEDFLSIDLPERC